MPCKLGLKTNEKNLTRCKMSFKDKDTRYFLDIDLTSKTIINLDFGNKFEIKQHLEIPIHRIFISLGQYNKILEKWD